jgi:hypothetical protein
MQTLCPLCNGLIPLKLNNCSICGACFEDKGPISSYLDPYSPYEIDEYLTNEYEDVKDNVCVHLLVCPQCGNEKNIYIDLVSV